MASKAEREIRNTLVDWFHKHEPQARMVHELNVDNGRIRADVAAVFSDTLILFEIKSEKDKLTRLRTQFEGFSQCSHATFIVAHEKHFDGDILQDCEWMRYSHKERLWKYPGAEEWKFNRFGYFTEPQAHTFLNLLWNEELKSEYRFTGRTITSHDDRWNLIHGLTLALTGKEIREAVCRRLRAREFAEADTVIEVV